MDTLRLFGNKGKWCVAFKITQESLIEAIKAARKRSILVLPDGAQNLANIILQILEK